MDTDINGAERLFKNIQDGEFTIPFTFLDEVFTRQLVQGGMITDKEFIKIRTMTPNNASQNVTVDTAIYKYLEN